MPKEEWGVKRVCPHCATRFYDLQNDPMTCPNCGETFDLATLNGEKSKTAMADKADKSAIKESTESDLADDVDVLDDDDDIDVEMDDDLLEDDEVVTPSCRTSSR